MESPRRFGDLQQALPGIASNVLTSRLRQLEADRLILAVPYSRRPVRYAYELTDSGRGLGGAVRLLTQWSADRDEGRSDTPAHPACGTPMVARWWCPTCETAGDPSPADIVWV